MPQQAEIWIASRSLSSGARSRDPVARNDGPWAVGWKREPRGYFTAPKRL